MRLTSAEANEPGLLGRISRHLGELPQTPHNGVLGIVPTHRITPHKSASRLERVHPPPGTSAVCAYSVKLTWGEALGGLATPDRKSTRLNSSHANISYAV